MSVDDLESCDMCGELKPLAGGETRTEMMWVDGAGYVSRWHYWYCADCVRLREEQEVAREEDRAEQYYDLK